MNVKAIENTDAGTKQIIITMQDQDFQGGGVINISEALTEAAKELAITYVRDHQKEILESLSPLSITNLAIAESAKLVRESFIDPERKSKVEAN